MERQRASLCRKFRDNVAVIESHLRCQLAETRLNNRSDRRVHAQTMRDVVAYQPAGERQR
jgi:hypothetical protein